MASLKPAAEGAALSCQGVDTTGSNSPPAKKARVEEEEEEAPFSLLSSLPNGIVQRHVLPFLGYNTLMRSVLRVNKQLRDSAVDRLVQDIAVEKRTPSVCLEGWHDANFPQGDVKQVRVTISLGAGNTCFASREGLIDMALEECKDLADQQTDDMGGFELANAEDGNDNDSMTLDEAMARSALEDTGEVNASSGYGFCVRFATEELSVDENMKYSIGNMPVSLQDEEKDYEIAYAVGCFSSESLYPAMPVLERCLLSLLQRAEPNKPMRLSKLVIENHHPSAGLNMERKESRHYLQFFVQQDNFNSNSNSSDSQQPQQQQQTPSALPVEFEIITELTGEDSTEDLYAEENELCENARQEEKERREASNLEVYA